MRMNGEKDEFLFLEVEREGLVFILSKGRLIGGELNQLIVNELQSR